MPYCNLRSYLAECITCGHEVDVLGLPDRNSVDFEDFAHDAELCEHLADGGDFSFTEVEP